MNSGLFADTAEFYYRYRVPFPTELIDEMVAGLQLDGSGVLLDVACGTGALTVPLSSHVDSVIAVDIDADMLTVAQRHQLSNVDWRHGSAEDLMVELSDLKAVTFGRSFHWFDREHVLELLDSAIAPGGGIALAGGGGLGEADIKRGIHNGTWEATAIEVLERYVGPTWMTQTALQPALDHVKILSESAFSEVSVWNQVQRRQWSFEDLVGYFYSTSFAGPSRWDGSESRDAFEAELRSALNGEVLTQEDVWELIIAKRPT